jgi:hypothetical protein
MKKYIIASFVVLLNIAASCAQTPRLNPSFQHGLWICSMPAPASRLDEHFTDARGMIELPYAVLDELAHENEGTCRRVNSDSLKIVNFDAFWKVAQVSDGKETGYVGMLSYTDYMSFHVVRSAQ